MSKFEALTIQENRLPIVRLHPIVVMDILNAYSRRTDQDSRVIGTLLGVVKEDGVEITDCFGTAHQEVLLDGKATVKLDTNEAQLTRLAFHRRINKRDNIVGWYATTSANGALLTEFSSPIHRHYTEHFCRSPIHLVVDTSLRGDHLNVRAFVGGRVSLDGRDIADKFEEVRVEYLFSEGESTCLHHMVHSQVTATPFESSTIVSALPSETERVKTATVNLLAVLQQLESYVDEVVKGALPASAETGIALSDALSSLQAINVEEVAAALQDRSNDLLMLSYITSLTQAQIQISERLNSVL